MTQEQADIGKEEWLRRLAPDLIKARRKFGPALKDKTNPHFRSKYADLGACFEAVDDALLANGIAVYQETFESETGVTVETVFLHETGESLRCGRLHVPAAKHDPQGFGSALTYARRYSLMTACGIAPEDDDGNAAAKAKPKHADGILVTGKQVMERAMESLDEEQQRYIHGFASKVTKAVGDGLVSMAVDLLHNEGFDADQKMALWGTLAAPIRTAIKTEEDRRKANNGAVQKQAPTQTA